jgi:hypothetical protein
MNDSQTPRRSPRALSTWIPEGGPRPPPLQARLSSAVRRLDGALQEHGVTMVQLDREGAIVFASPGLAGLRPGARLAALTRAPDAFRGHHRAALQGTTAFEVVLCTGERLSCRASPLRLEGRVVGVLLLGRASAP